MKVEAGLSLATRIAKTKSPKTHLMLLFHRAASILGNDVAFAAQYSFLLG